MLRAILFVVLMSGGLVAAVFSRFGALLVYLWFALFRPQEWMWFDITSLRLSLILGLLLVVPSLFSGYLPNITHPLSIGSLSFLMLAVLAQANAFSPATGWVWLDFLGRLILVSLFLVTLVDSRRRFVLMIAVVAGSLGYFTAKAGLASFLSGGATFAEGLAGAFSDNNGYGLATAMVMPLLLAAGQNLSRTGSMERWVRRGFLFAVPLSALTVVATNSRGAFLALATATLAWVLLQKRRMFAMVSLSLALLVAVPLLPIGAAYVDRLRTITTYEEVNDGSALGRLHFWEVAVDMAKAYPLGVGLQNYETAYDTFDSSNGAYGQGRAVHSSHFQVLAETGFLGTAVWIFQFAYAFIVCLRIRRRALVGAYSPDDAHFLFTMSNGLFASMCSFLVGGAFLAMALNDLTWLTFAMIAALDRLAHSLSTSAAAEAPSAARVGVGHAAAASS